MSSAHLFPSCAAQLCCFVIWQMCPSRQHCMVSATHKCFYCGSGKLDWFNCFYLMLCYMEYSNVSGSLNCHINSCSALWTEWWIFHHMPVPSLPQQSCRLVHSRDSEHRSPAEQWPGYQTEVSQRSEVATSCGVPSMRQSANRVAARLQWPHQLCLQIHVSHADCFPRCCSDS